MNTMLDSGDVWDRNDVSRRLVLENINDMITGTDKQVIRVFHPQSFSIRGVDGVRFEWSSLLQLSNFVRDHEFKLASSCVGDKTPLNVVTTYRFNALTF